MSRRAREPSSRKGRAAGVAAALAVVICGRSSFADEAESLSPRIELHHDTLVDASITGGLAAGTIVWAFVRPSALPTTCVICDGSPGTVDGLDDWFRRGLKRDDTGPAKTFSDVFGYGLAPLSALGLTSFAAGVDRRLDEAPLDMLLVAEASAIDIAIDQVTIAFTRRERPDYHFLSPEARGSGPSANDVSSMPSGHVSAAFAMAASAGTIASLRGYRLAPFVWVVGMLIGGSTAYFRIAGDRHYFTDTLAGAALGTVTGVGVPLLFHSRASRPSGLGWLYGAHIATTDVPGGRAVTLGWAF
jgi:hypothetical protein